MLGAMKNVRFNHVLRKSKHELQTTQTTKMNTNQTDSSTVICHNISKAFSLFLNTFSEEPQNQ